MLYPAELWGPRPTKPNDRERYAMTDAARKIELTQDDLDEIEAAKRDLDKADHEAGKARKKLARVLARATGARAVAKKSAEETSLIAQKLLRRSGLR